jgi:hypothetical protein
VCGRRVHPKYTVKSDIKTCRILCPTILGNRVSVYTFLCIRLLHHRPVCRWQVLKYSLGFWDIVRQDHKRRCSPLIVYQDPESFWWACGVIEAWLRVRISESKTYQTKATELLIGRTLRVYYVRCWRRLVPDRDLEPSNLGYRLIRPRRAVIPTLKHKNSHGSQEARLKNAEVTSSTDF